MNGPQITKAPSPKCWNYIILYLNNSKLILFSDVSKIRKSKVLIRFSSQGGGGLVVSALTYCSEDTSSIPTDY